MFKKNMGGVDRAVRIAIAVVAAIAAIAVGGGWSILLWAVAAIMLLTSVVSFCPLYSPFGISTCKVDPSS